MGKTSADGALAQKILTMSLNASTSNSSRRNFETGGPSWSERALSGELRAVLSPTSATRFNLFLHHAHLAAAKFALRRCAPGGTILDYGCGTGRFLRFFSSRGYRVIGMDITPEMLAEANRIGLPLGCETQLTDGSTLPLPNASVDVIWVCGVLKYTLFPPGVPSRGGKPKDAVTSAAEFVPTYGMLAHEMFRVLKPGGWVANLEMYVDVLPDAFLPDFELAGFITEKVDVVQRYGGFERRFQSNSVPTSLIPLSAAFCVWLRRVRDNPNRDLVGFRDYLYLWRKPAAKCFPHSDEN